MERNPNFKIDDEVYGKFGEKDFEEYMLSLNYCFLNVSDNEMYQLADIDYLASKLLDLPCYGLDGINNHELIYSREANKRNIYKFEVKTDTRAHITRNVVYEIISHDTAGCLGESKADYVYYVFVDDTSGEIVKKEAWSINLPKWRKYLREHFFETKVGLRESRETWGIIKNNYNIHDDCVANLLCNIDMLEKNGVAKKVY